MLYIVGVGTGDPELVTLKAARLIHEADAIVLADAGTGKSVVKEILGSLLDGKPVYPLSTPMKGMKADWGEAHRKAAAELLGLLAQYESVVYPVLGDPGIYASSMYLVKLIEPHHPCTIVPGITTMCDASARLHVPLCDQGESLTVIDGFDPAKGLPDGNVVIMKSGKSLAAIQAALQGREAYAVRNLGMSNEWQGRLDAISADEYSYFTTIIVKKA